MFVVTKNKLLAACLAVGIVASVLVVAMPSQSQAQTANNPECINYFGGATTDPLYSLIGCINHKTLAQSMAYAALNPEQIGLKGPKLELAQAYRDNHLIPFWNEFRTKFNKGERVYVQLQAYIPIWGEVNGFLRATYKKVSINKIYLKGARSNQATNQDKELLQSLPSIGTLNQSYLANLFTQPAEYRTQESVKGMKYQYGYVGTPGHAFLKSQIDAFASYPNVNQPFGDYFHDSVVYATVVAGPGRVAGPIKNWASRYTTVKIGSARDPIVNFLRTGVQNGKRPQFYREGGNVYKPGPLMGNAMKFSGKTDDGKFFILNIFDGDAILGTTRTSITLRSVGKNTDKCQCNFRAGTVVQIVTNTGGTQARIFHVKNGRPATLRSISSGERTVDRVVALDRNSNLTDFQAMLADIRAARVE